MHIVHCTHKATFLTTVWYNYKRSHSKNFRPPKVAPVYVIKSTLSVKNGHNFMKTVLFITSYYVTSVTLVTTQLLQQLCCREQQCAQYSLQQRGVAAKNTANTYFLQFMLKGQLTTLDTVNSYKLYVFDNKKSSTTHIPLTDTAKVCYTVIPTHGGKDARQICLSRSLRSTYFKPRCNYIYVALIKNNWPLWPNIVFTLRLKTIVK